MLDQDQELIQEFVTETQTNLARLDTEMVELEQKGGDPDLLASIFRTVHTIKGTCGFLGYEVMEKVAHAGENLLNRLRNKELAVTEGRVTVILEMVDRMKSAIEAIAATGQEPKIDPAPLVARIEAAEQDSEDAAAAPVPQMLQALDGAQPAAETASPAARAVSDPTIRIDVALADKLVNLVGELVLVRNQMLRGAESNSAADSTHRLNLITTELQESVMKTRMQPVGTVWSKLPRVTRDLASSLGKKIQLRMEGEDTEMDRSVVEAIRDPLTHIVRNSCDHGIESPERRRAAGKPEMGTLWLKAFHEGGQVVIEISDDGGGIAVDRVRQKALEKGLVDARSLETMAEREVFQLIFLPGFSTAEKVSNVSGRGVGMDVVRNNIQKIGGSVDLDSVAGQGTTLRIRIPLTLAIIPGLLVTSGGERYVIPQVSVQGLLRLEPDQAAEKIANVGGKLFYRDPTRIRPLLELNEILGRDREAREGTRLIAFVRSEGREFGLLVDRILSTREIVVKPLCQKAKEMGLFAGATILDDGRVALILDVAGMSREFGTGEETRMPPATDSVAAVDARAMQRTLLLFSACRTDARPMAMPLESVGRLEKLEPKEIESADGRPVVRYRNSILPLLPLGSMVRRGCTADLGAEGTIEVVVVHRSGKSLGLMVGKVHDIRSGTMEAWEESANPALLGTGVFAGRVCDVVNVDYLANAWASGLD